MSFGSHTRKCLICRATFTKKRAMQKIPDDHINCLLEYTKRENEKKARQAIRESIRASRIANKEHRAKLEASRKLSWHINRARTACHQYIKVRDYGLPCICCGESMDWARNGKDIQAGHWRTQAAAGHLRFNEDNIHAQRAYCNKQKAGNQSAMKLGMIARIGAARVEALECDNRIHNWTREELAEVTAYYRAKTKELLRQRDFKEAA